MWILLITMVMVDEYTDHWWMPAATKAECVEMGEVRVRFHKDDPTTLLTYQCVRVVEK